ncbi:alpha/beta hydrolase [Streptomyces sp. IBSNAI002]|uniref:alpha/beta hydrolase n=1 Tax=Streptomyces sp. IBSNAI002 TaxID=3457500 RepID=UPI003FD1D4E3
MLISRFARLRRALAALAIVVAVVVPLTAASRPHIPAPAPDRLAPATAATLPQAYAANRANILQAARAAESAGASGRAARLRALAEDGRQYLTFDGRGPGRVVEVMGDLAHADRIAVLVPGADTDLDTYDALGGNPPAGLVRRDHAASSCTVPATGAVHVDHRSLGGAALELRGQLCQQDPAAKVAVVTWLGYDTPGLTGPAILTDSRARAAAPALRAFLATVHRVNPQASVTLLCHSYGSVVCGQAAPRLNVASIVLFASPGVDEPDVAALHTRAAVWAGRGSGDWIAGIPHLSIGLPGGASLGFGQDPTAAAFGARRFAAGPGGHSDYFTPGSLSLRNLAHIVLDQDPEPAHA